MDTATWIRTTEVHVKRCLGNDFSGHGWDHVHRVRQLAVAIGKAEGADLFVVEMAALLHDIGDPKLHHGDETLLLKLPEVFCRELGLNTAEIDKILAVIGEVSYRGAGTVDENTSLESKVVQDADRLDAIGAIGVARCLYYGGYHHRVLHDPEVLPEHHADYAAYRRAEGTTINHFYEKLLLLKDRLHTPTAKEIAVKRHAFMETFLANFLEEWNT